MSKLPSPALVNLVELTDDFLDAAGFPFPSKDPLCATLDAAITSKEEKRVKDLVGVVILSGFALDGVKSHKATLRIADVFAQVAYRAGAVDVAAKLIPVAKTTANTAAELQSYGCDTLAQLVTKARTP